MLQWVLENSTVDSEIFAEQIYSALYQPDNVCPLGNTKQFKSIFSGYGFCNKVSDCRCAKQSVSQKVSASKKSYSDKQKQSINQKRKQTTMSRYGVENNAQTKTAKANHKKFYQDQLLVNSAVQKNKKTKFEKYGDSTYNNPLKIKKTLKQRLDLDYWQARYPEKGLAELQDKEKLLALYQTHTIDEIAKKLLVHPQTVYRHLNNLGIREPFKSAEEAEVVRFLQECDIKNIIQNSRSILPSRKELDIYLPDYNLAIEYNGVYWHHEDVDHITRSYHKQKFNECASIGIQLITIFSTEWKSKKHIVKQILKNRLGINNNKVFARQCKIVENVTSKQARQFLDQYHIQGYAPSSLKYGLEYNNELVALMTFSKCRVGMGVRSDAHELVRFASSVRVVGGASKLLKHFVNNNQFTKLISYSDNEWSNGNLYHALGFELEQHIPPSYWYLKPHEEKLHHRYNFAKHKLVEKGYDRCKTEKQITQEMGLLKIWDCGKKRWAYSPPNSQV